MKNSILIATLLSALSAFCFKEGQDSTNATNLLFPRESICDLCFQGDGLQLQWYRAVCQTSYLVQTDYPFDIATMDTWTVCLELCDNTENCFAFSFSNNLATDNCYIVIDPDGGDGDEVPTSTPDPNIDSGFWDYYECPPP